MNNNDHKLNGNNQQTYEKNDHTHENNEHHHENGDKEGLVPALWGPSTWESLHCISFNYPHNPTNEQKNNYKAYFMALQHVLPCCLCRASLGKFLLNGPTKLTDDVMTNRQTLTKWLYTLHNAVDNKLGTKYNISYKQLCDKYNKYIAKCDLSDEQWKNAYMASYNKEAPLMEYEYARLFIKYAIKRGFNDFEKNIARIEMLRQQYNNNNKNDIDVKIKFQFATANKHDIPQYINNWKQRNKLCTKMIEKFRINSIPFVEQDGKYKGLPTLQELELMQLLSTRMPIESIHKLMPKLKSSFINSMES